jgi:peptidyl-prolyl cis-trans isomerase SurA
MYLKISKLKTVTLCAITALLSGMAFSTNAQSMIVDKVIAKIGSELVLLSDLEDQYQYIAKQQPGIGPDAKCGIMENLIAQKVIIYQAKLDSVEVTDAELDAQLDYRFESILRQMNGDEEFFKEYYGYTVSEMRDRVREDQKQQILAEKMQGSLIGSVTITPKEVEEFYNSIPADSLPFLNAEVEISEIVMAPQVNAEERQKTLEQITQVREDIIAGKISFEEAAKKYSSDGTASRGGDLGFAKRGVYVPAFEATAFQLKKDEISDIVETEFGFHIIQLIERRGNSIHVRHVLMSPKITPADEELARQVLDSIRTEIENDSLSFEVAVKRHSLKDTPSYGNSGRIKNPKTGNTFFETNDLDPDIYFEIIDLEPGQLTKVFEATDLRGGKLFKIIKLVSETRPHKANLEQDYNKIALFAKESKKNIFFNEWVSEKMEETYIKVDNNYNFCENLDQWIDEPLKP